MSGAASPNSTGKIRKEYDYVLDELSLIAYNGASYPFTSHFACFTYEESIFTSPAGLLLAMDAVDYPTLLPIIGEEKIKASFTRQVEDGLSSSVLEPITFEMNVYSMSGRTQTGSSMKRQNYTLYYTSDLPFLNTSQRVFKAYKSKLYSEIVADICSQYLNVGKKLVIETTKYTQDYLIQNERPMAAIRKICQRALSAESSIASDNGSFFLFFEDRDTIYFTTASKLLQSAPVIELRYEPKNTLDVESGDKNIEKDIYNVDALNITGQFDTLASLMSGEGGGTLLAVDPIRRKRTNYDFDLHRDYDKIAHLEKSKTFTENSKYAGKTASTFKMILSNREHDTLEHIVSRDANIKPNFIEDVKLTRESQKAQLLKNTTSLTLSGDPRIRAGSVITFAMPEMMGKVNKENPQELDAYFQGKYLVTYVKHMLRHGDYRMQLELVRDSFFSDINHRDPIEEMTDIK